MRLGEPRMPNLLVAHHRPGFYMRVITEGHVAAGDPIVQTRRGRHELSVADIDALLYLPDRDIEALRKAVDVPALSPGWQGSFHDLIDARESSSAATTPPVEPAWVGFRPLRVSATHRESPTVLSIELHAADDAPLPTPLAGQYLTIKITAGDGVKVRSYSLSGDPGTGFYRISVKREEHGEVSAWLHSHIRVGSTVSAAAPRGDFYLTDDDSPVVLFSAGVGATPVLAMLHSLAAAGSQRRIWWVHTTQTRESHAFATEVGTLIESLPHAVQHVFYTATGGRPGGESIAALSLPTDATVYLCGPGPFMDAMRDVLTAAGINPAHVHTELFGALPPINPGVVDAPPPVRPHPPSGTPGAGPLVTFARTGLSVNWSPHYHSLLELAEACDIPTRYSCRSGVCHTCVTGVITGTPAYTAPPLEQPSDGEVLICCAAPRDDLVLDL